MGDRYRLQVAEDGCMRRSNSSENAGARIHSVTQVKGDLLKNFS